ncbi:MAG: YkgJ family cysteine cluster protein [Melioribacteraceae bacterium]|nr:YkgJ family cysteine cluster protein [Melioribacteraceae bacterium]
MPTEISRCTGHCCKDFTLAYSPEELKKEFDETLSKNRKILKQIKDREKRYDETISYMKSDIYLVPQMVIHLASIEVNCNGELHPLTLHHYTCTNHDPVTGNCKIYEARPRMCSNFPYYDHPNGECPYKGCTMKYEKEVNSEPMEKHLSLKEEKAA